MKNGWIVTAIIGLMTTACSDGSDGSLTRATLPEPVNTIDVVVVGPITGFGSVRVNGVEFDTSSATITMDGEPGTESDLRVGMMASIHGIVDTTTGAARASEITFTDDAEGPVSSIDTVSGSFVVLGRPVVVDELTVFEDVTFETLDAGNVVQVSGQWLSQERIKATYVHRIANAYQAGMTIEVNGVISELDIGHQRFNIGTQMCDYNSAAMIDLGGAALAEGMYVEVSSTTPLVDGIMMLNQIQARDRDRDMYQFCAAGCDCDLVGYVTWFDSPTEFEVDCQPVTTTPNTEFVNGTVDTLALDIKVAVTGMLNADGVLVAERIAFRLPSLIEIKADIEAIDLDTEVVNVLGIDVQTNESTLFRDHTTSGSRQFGFEDLVFGDRLEIRGVHDGSSVIAARLERDYAEDEVTLKATVESIARPSITLLGVTVTSDENTVFQNEAHVIIDADTFFASVELDSLVRTEGIYDGTSILASRMFLRECVNNCL